MWARQHQRVVSSTRSLGAGHTPLQWPGAAGLANPSRRGLSPAGHGSRQCLCPPRETRAVRAWPWLAPRGWGEAKAAYGVEPTLARDGESLREAVDRCDRFVQVRKPIVERVQHGHLRAPVGPSARERHVAPWSANAPCASVAPSCVASSELFYSAQCACALRQHLLVPQQCPLSLLAGSSCSQFVRSVRLFFLLALVPVLLLLSPSSGAVLAMRAVRASASVRFASSRRSRTPPAAMTASRRDWPAAMP